MLQVNLSKRKPTAHGDLTSPGEDDKSHSKSARQRKRWWWNISLLLFLHKGGNAHFSPQDDMGEANGDYIVRQTGLLFSFNDLGQ